MSRNIYGQDWRNWRNKDRLIQHFPYKTAFRFSHDREVLGTLSRREKQLTASATTILDWDRHNFFNITVSSDCAFEVINPRYDSDFVFYLKKDSGATAREITFPSDWTWLDTTPPDVLRTSEERALIFVYLYNGEYYARYHNIASISGGFSARDLYSFGAVGDGVTDDSAAVNAALDWASSGGELGRALNVTSGKFLLGSLTSTSLSNHAKMAIRGDATGSILVANTTGGIFIECEGSASYLEVNDLYIPAHLEDAGTLLKIYGSYSGSGGGVDHNTLILQNVNGTPIQRANSRFYSLDPFIFTRLKRPYLENLRYTPGKNAFTNESTGDAEPRDWGTALIDVSNCYGPTIIGGKIGGSADYGILMDYTGTISAQEAGQERATEGGYVNDIRITNTKYCIGFLTDTEQPGLKIEGNHFNPSKTGILIDGAKRFRIDNNLIYSNNGTVYTWTRQDVVHPNRLTVTADEPHRIPNLNNMQVRVNFDPQDIEDPDYDPEGDGEGVGDVPPSGTYTPTYVSDTVFTIEDVGFGALGTSGVLQVRWATSDFSDIEIRNGRHGRISNNMFGQQVSRRRRHWKFDMTNSVKASPVIFDMEVDNEFLSARTVVEPLYVGDDVDLLTAHIPYTTGDGYDSVSYPDNPASVSAAATRVIVNDRMDGFDERSEGGLINLVPNGKFARGSKGWDASAGWTISVDATDALTLNSKARYVGPDTSNGNLYMKTPSPCEEGAPVLVEWYYKVASGTVSNHRARANFYDVDGLDVGSTSFGDSVTSTPSDWTRRSYAFTVPSGAVTFVAGVQIATSTGGTVDIDRISAMQPISVAMAEGARGELVVSDGGATIMPSFEYEDTAALAAATVPAIVTRVYTRYRTAANKIGGAWYKRAAAEPAHAIKVQDAAGSWWEFDETAIDIRQAGALVNDAADDTTAILNAIAYMKALGGGEVLFPRGTTCISATLDIDQGHVHLVGMGEAAYRGTSAQITGAALSRIKWIGAAGGRMVKFESPEGGFRQNGGGMRRLMVDGNAFLADTGLEIRTWQCGRWEDLYVYACNVDHILTGVTSRTLIQTPYDTQNNMFLRCRVSTRGSGVYASSTATGWRLTGNKLAPGGANTSINQFIHCHALMSLGQPWKLENCDTNTFISSGGAAQLDDTVYGFELGSGDQDSTGNGVPSRYNMIQNTQAEIHVRAGQTGNASSTGNYIVINRGNASQLPTFETPAGGSEDPTATVIDIDGTILLAGKRVLGPRVDGWEIPIGPASRTTFDTTTVTTATLAEKVKALIADLSTMKAASHGMIGTVQAASTADADIVAGEERDVLAISFVDNTLRIRDTVTPANNYSGTATGKLTVTGSLSAGANGAFFDASNFATLLLTAMPWSATGGSLMVEFYDDAIVSGANATLVSIDNGTSGERIVVRSISTTGDKPHFAGIDGGVKQWSIQATNWPVYVNGETKRIAVSWAANDAAACYDGGTVGLDVTSTLPTPTTFRLGVNHSGAEPGNCRIKRIVYTPRVLSEDELIVLSVA